MPYYWLLPSIDCFMCFVHFYNCLYQRGRASLILVTPSSWKLKPSFFISVIVFLFPEVLFSSLQICLTTFYSFLKLRSFSLPFISWNTRTWFSLLSVSANSGSWFSSVCFCASWCQLLLLHFILPVCLVILALCWTFYYIFIYRNNFLAFGKGTFPWEDAHRSLPVTLVLLPDGTTLNQVQGFR